MRSCLLLLTRCSRRASAVLGLALLLAPGCTRGPKPPEEGPSGASAAAEAPAVHDPAAQGAAPRAHAPAAPGDRAVGGAAFDPTSPQVGGITFRAPAPFAYRAPTVAMRSAEYVVAGPSEAESAVLAIHHFPGMGGSVEANLARWIGQFTQPDGRDSREVARVGTVTVSGLEVARVDVTGTYTGMQPGTGATGAALEGQRLVGAIVRSPEGPVFFKFVGPASLVESALPAFDELVASVAVAPGR